MKVVSWNCNGALRKKYDVLDDLDADILVIQECEDPARSDDKYKQWADNFLWVGKNKNKGIGIFARKSITLTKLNWIDNDLEVFLPCRVNGKFNLLGVWTKQANSPNFAYIGQFWKYLQLNKNEIQNNKIVMCGDFNSNSCWDEWDRWWNHSDVVKELQEIDIESLYHFIHNEKQGFETRPTFFLHRKKERSYHIDYVFASSDFFLKKSISLLIDDAENWLSLSDHLPIVFSIPEIELI